MIEIKKNKSTTYFLPLFDSYFRIKYFKLLQNTYFFYDDIGEDVFCILYKFDGKVTGSYQRREGFTIYEQFIRSNRLYMSEEDHGEYVIYIFKLPDELIEVKHLLLDGKYSKLTDSHKEKIVNFTYEKYGGEAAKKVNDILYKSKELKERLEDILHHTISEDAELSSIIESNEETFINSIKKETEV